MPKLLLLMCLWFCAACTMTNTRAVVVPLDVVNIGGGIYQSWTPVHEAMARDVLTCVGLNPEGPRPSLWVFPRPLMTDSGQIMMAFYDREAHAVVFSPIITQETYWLVFKHEIIHSVEQKPDHSKVFDKAVACGFWPSPITH